MKPICLKCGEPIIGWTPRRRFCSSVCQRRVHNRPKPFLISKDFEFFKNIVAAAETADEFKELYHNYFEEKFYDN